VVDTADGNAASPSLIGRCSVDYDSSSLSPFQVPYLQKVKNILSESSRTYLFVFLILSKEQMNTMIKDSENKKSLSQKVYAKDLNKAKPDDTIIRQMSKQESKA
jgi:hypothetical protein